MITVSTVVELREALRTLRNTRTPGKEPDAQATVGFVPTMGALHEGHLSLVVAARAEHPIVVLSIFVNPTQFNDQADFRSYPRDEQRDAQLAEAAGVDVLFVPTAEEMYPDGFATTVRVSGTLTEVLEGEHRGSSHFDGMTTIVSKLLIAVEPEAAYFGEKDMQQLLVVKQCVADLRLPVDIVGCPTLREPDGLARSSRNVLLDAEERERARAIPQTLELVHTLVADGHSDVQELTERATRHISAAGLAIDYLAFANATTLEPVHTVGNDTLFAIAVRAGSIRLIDNMLISSSIEPSSNTHEETTP